MVIICTDFYHFSDTSMVFFKLVSHFSVQSLVFFKAHLLMYIIISNENKWFLIQNIKRKDKKSNKYCGDFNTLSHGNLEKISLEVFINMGSWSLAFIQSIFFQESAHNCCKTK